MTIPTATQAFRWADSGGGACAARTRERSSYGGNCSADVGVHLKPWHTTPMPYFSSSETAQPEEDPWHQHR
ncbi:hypothetical protein GCM10010121_071460 [Streptomyces brasiliensis]|uniref:Uncharacterized protein n=1 Tax=Streptomyces brasiliensis TaxID=1954 RepID=A0A917P1C5_9ACTN|nr:hypothetical protein GCM10010121_071460 [Streptomyces brasiliensis]